MAIERIVPGTAEWEAFYGNHIQRYRFAKERLDIIKPRKILDAACGVGYGSNFLQQQGDIEIVAIDRSKDALAIANKQFVSGKVKFMEDDCHTLARSAESAPFDAIVSFETLEHLPQPEAFLKSCNRVLKNGGMLVISTPNSCVSSPDGKLEWEFHEKEYNPFEFVELLEKNGFGNIELYGQHLNETGRLKVQLRASLNVLYSNPFIRLGRWLQSTFRGRKFGPVLPELEEDLVIRPHSSPEEIYEAGTKGPFVLIAVAYKE